MTVRVLLAKHVPDFRRNEPRNVGVIVTDGEVSAARFAGETGPGRIDGHKVRRLVGKATGASVYREWVRFWREELNRGAVGIVDLLSEAAPNFYITEAADVWDEEAGDLEALADHFYSRLVHHPEGDDDGGLQDRVRTILEQAAIPSLPGFRRQLQVAAAVDTPRPVTIRFPFGIQNGNVTVGEQADFSRRDRVHTVLWRFEHVSESVHRICFYRANHDSEEDLAYLEILQARCVPINVDAPDAEGAAWAAFNRG